MNTFHLHTHRKCLGVMILRRKNKRIWQWNEEEEKQSERCGCCIGVKLSSNFWEHDPENWYFYMIFFFSIHRCFYLRLLVSYACLSIECPSYETMVKAHIVSLCIFLAKAWSENLSAERFYKLFDGMKLFSTVNFKTMAPPRSSIHNNNHHVFMSVLIPCYFISSFTMRKNGRENMLIFLFFPPKLFPSHVVIIMMEIIISGKVFWAISAILCQQRGTQSSTSIFMNCLFYC